MGIDFLDMNFRLEKRFGFYSEWPEYEAAIGSRPTRDITAGEVSDLVQRKIHDLRRQAADYAPTDPPVRSSYINYDGRRKRRARTNTEWNVPDDRIWPIVRQIIAETLGLDLDEVRREALLVKDLGMT